MEHSKVEVAVVSDAVSKAADEQIVELNDLQLALIGGGGVDCVPQ